MTDALRKTVVLIDVDETIIDTKYKLNTADQSAEPLKAAIARLTSRGVRVGLNSDTAMENLKRRGRIWGAHGPFIAERGGSVSAGIGYETHIVTPDNQRFLDMRERFVTALQKGRRAEDYLSAVGDIRVLYKNLPNLDSELDLPCIAVLVNGVRECSFSFYTHGWDKEKNQWDPYDTESLLELVIIWKQVCDELRIDPESLDDDINPDYGICIIHDPRTQKAEALDTFCDLFSVERVIMIGNSMADYMEDQRVTHCAVGNAHPDFKAAATMVTKQKLTRGVIKLLELLAKRL